VLQATGVLGVGDAVDSAAELLRLQGLLELSGLGVEALHAPVLAVRHADQVLVLGQGQPVRDVQAVGAWNKQKKAIMMATL
jgi:hypothetical protein